jgi:AcrR family transcriptional regulator
LLDAAWAQLAEHGYASFTLDAVALRAKTSTPVLYRRWPTRHALVEAAVAHAVARRAVEIPDTGTYRGDLLAMMRWANQNRADLLAGMTIVLGAYFAETRLSPADLRAKVLGLRPSAAETLLDRAVRRGEVDPAVVSPRLASLPFDLFRHEVLTTLQPVPDAVIEEILDRIVLPLLRCSSAGIDD